MSAKIETVFGIIVLAIPAMAIAIGIWLVWGQHQRLTQFQPVEATVFGKEIGQRHSSKGGVREYPIVEYEYQVAGVRYTSDEVFPIPVSYKGSWARRVITPFNVGDRVQAFFNPDDPNDAYLLREADFAPYFFVLFPMIFVMIGIAILGYGRGRPALHALQYHPGRGFLVPPQLSLAKRTRIAGGMTSLWYGVGGVAIGHYYVVAAPPYGKLAVIGSSVYLALGLIPLSMFKRRWRLPRMLADATVYTDTDCFAPGDSIAVRADQNVHAEGRAKEMQLAIVQQIHSRSSSGGSTTHTTTHRDLDRQTFPLDRDVVPGNSLSASTHFTIPANAPATSPASAIENPRYDYYIEVITRVSDWPNYAGRFAFRLHSATVGSQR